MDENASPSGQLSEDGQWAWTGDQWVPAGGEPIPSEADAYGQMGPDLAPTDPSAGQGYQTLDQFDSGYSADPAYAQTAYGQDPAAYGQTAYSQDPAAYGQTAYSQDPAAYGQDPAAYGQTAYGQASGSPESGWRWDGAQWVPVTSVGMPPPAATTGQRKLSPIIIAALVAALVIVAVLIVWFLTSDSGTEPTTAPPAPAVTTSSEPAESPTVEASPTFESSPSATDPGSVFGTESATADPLNTTASPTGALTVDQAAAAVDWTRFATGTQQRVDSAASSGNCAELQTLREAASANDAAVLAATGAGTADLVAYIDAQERAVGCTVSPVP